MSTKTFDRELVIQSIDGGCEIALLENKELVEFHRDTFSSSLAVGDVYWARVKKIMPPLNAVFVDIGEGKEAFLHYTDLGEHFATMQAYFNQVFSNNMKKMEDFSPLPSLDKAGKIADVFAVNDYLAVQVLKEPMNTKGARLSADISLAGRYLVLTPFASQISISKKISQSSERERLKKITQNIATPNLGVIIRTVAETKSVKELHEDFLELKAKWTLISTKIIHAQGVKKLFEEESTSNTLLRDILNDSFTKIHVNNTELANSVTSYIEKIAPDKVDLVKNYNKPLLFEEFNLTTKIKSAFNKIIPLPSGGYIIVENTEAMFVIDVNSGVHKSKKNDLGIEAAILKINLEAAREIARQLRLRDIGGIIVIDFIDTRVQDIKDKILQEMHDAMRTDKANHSILPLSKFCVMQITRSRTKPSEVVKTKEVCPSCNGSGKISNLVLITDLIFNKLQSIIQDEKGLTMVVHPFLHAFLTKGIFSEFLHWQWKLKMRVKIQKNASLGINEYYFINKEGETVVF
jgi:ribonuclease G